MYLIEINEAQKNVLEALSEIDQALVKKDAKSLDRSISADFIGTTPTGEYFRKENYIEHHCRPEFGIQSLETGDSVDLNIRLFGNTALINRRVHVQFKVPAGHIQEYEVQRTEVFSRDKENWVMVSGQGTKVIAVNPASL